MSSAEVLDSQLTMAEAEATTGPGLGLGFGIGIEHSAQCSSSSSLSSSFSNYSSDSISGLHRDYNPIANSGSLSAPELHFDTTEENFKRAYVGALLPELARIQQNAAPAAAATAPHWRAVKDAADLALAAAARRESNWRLALMEDVLLKRRRRRRRRSRINAAHRVASKRTDLLGPRGYIKVLRKVVKVTRNRCRSRRRCSLMSRQQRLIRRRLGRVIPGGMSMDVPLLLRETADYILTLQLQVDALRSLHAHLASGQQ